MKIFAYLDAGTGSMILQAAAGAIIATIVFIKGFGHRIRALFSRKKSDPVDKNQKSSK